MGYSVLSPDRSVFRNQVIVVTGASSGVGRALVRAYGAQGAKVGLLARNEEALRAAAEEVRTSGGEALVLPTDVSDAAAVERAAAQVDQQWGRIDVWVNCAMVTVFGTVADTTPEEFRRVTEVTYLGYVYGTLAALKRMRAANRGTIVQVGSALAYRSIPLQGAYCAAKAAIRGFTESLRTELLHEHSRVRLTQVHLPAVNTPQSVRQRNKMPRNQTPVPPLFSPESIAESILWATQHAPREMLVGQPTLQAVWANKFIPGLLDLYLAHNGFDSQMVDEPNTQRRDILFESQPGDPGAHGPYRDQERGPDWYMRLRTKPAAVSALGAGVAGALVGSLLGGWRR